ncbi:MAG: hypothetical protein L0I62_02360 [Gammaproteobacteria bacterium]|nr:hypothetical protein [Gammaproteobacteria bacterium]
MTGDYEARYAPGSRNNFVNFLYHEGVTGKGDKQRGSRGVGKVVFTMASRARTFFAYTIREDAPGLPLLLGKNVLKFRELNGTSWKGSAYFIQSWPEGGPREPVTDAATLKEFRETFHVAREPGDPGLSIVIPFRDPSITVAELRSAIIGEYHYAILSGKLEATIDHHGDVETLDAGHLPATGNESIDCQVGLARWALSQAAPERRTTIAPAADTTQRLEPDLVPENLREALGNALDGGQRIAIRIPVHVHPKDREPERSYFDLFLEYSDEYSNRPTFVRELLPVSSVHNARSAPHVRALVVIDEGPLADLLRAAEGANHTDWSSRTDRFREHYKGRLGEIPFVAQAVANLMVIVRGGNERPVGGIATKLFSARLEDKRAKVGKKNKGSGKQPEQKGKYEEKTKPKGYSVQRVKGGFVVRRSHPTDPRPAALIVRVAYDVIRGSAWSQWDPADFDFSADSTAIVFETKNASIDANSGKGNRFVVKPGSEPDYFSVRVTGFDPNRDLIIDHRAEMGGV